MNEQCSKCKADDWRVEKRTRNMHWYYVFVCEKCGYERLPNTYEREAFR